VQWFASFADMLQAVKPEGVVVATPHQLHLVNGLDVIGAGIPVLVEKPLAVDVWEASKLVPAAARERDEQRREDECGPIAAVDRDDRQADGTDQTADGNARLPDPKSKTAVAVEPGENRSSRRPASKRHDRHRK
jgi:hypothetical protein